MMETLQFRAMVEPDLERVMAIEVQAYSFPWSLGNFRDSLLAGYEAELMLHGEDLDELLGYWVAMPGVEEMHLLNLTVAPRHQRDRKSTRLNSSH